MSNQGWIKLHRQLKDNPIYKSSTAVHCWIECLLRAIHTDEAFFLKRQKRALKPGQFCMGRDEFGLSVGISGSTAWFWINQFSVDRMIDIKTSSVGTVVTVLKWKDYQGVDSEVDSRKTADEQRMNTIKNDKNVENDINITNVMDKSDVFAKRYGNADVNTVLARLSNLSPTGRLDGTDTDNRRMAHNLIRLYTLKVVLQSISNIPGSFYEGKITSVRKLKNSLNALLISETKGGIASI